MRLVLACAVVLSTAAAGLAQPGVSYPKVYGPTGSLYGPTQAHYQYQRQYGRAWTPPAGTVAGTPNLGLANGGYSYVAPNYGLGYNAGLANYGYANYGYGPYIGGYRGIGYASPIITVSPGVSIIGFQSGYPYGSGIQAIPYYHQGFTPVAPRVQQAYPLWVGGNPYDNEVIARSRLEEQQRWQAPLAIEPVTTEPRVLTPKSSPEMIARSVQHRTNGDSWFRKQRFTNAFDRYKSAIEAAGDLPDNHLRAGFSLVAMGRPALASKYFARAVELAPNLPETGMPLDELFGPENDLSRTSTILKTTAWVREDIRDPERLYVLGVLLHFDGQRDKAAEFFETAYRLRGGGDHLTAFLAPPEVVPVEAVEEIRPADVQPKVIEIPREGEQPNGPLLPLPE